MAQTKTTEVIQPLGAGDFGGAKPGGRAGRSSTKAALTPFGGLVPWAADRKPIGMGDHLAADAPVKRTRPHAAPV